ncbi:hypothetical protein ACU4GD_01145, partial [Cupriavidus basilensis]
MSHPLPQEWHVQECSTSSSPGLPLQPFRGTQVGTGFESIDTWHQKIGGEDGIHLRRSQDEDEAGGSHGKRQAGWIEDWSATLQASGSSYSRVRK